MAATLKEIAEICGVTVSTVSNVLNDKPKVSEEKKQQIMNQKPKLKWMRCCPLRISPFLKCNQ